MLLQGEPRDAAVNFDKYRILQRHRAISLPQHGFLVYITDDWSAEITHSDTVCSFSRLWRKITAIAENHGTRTKLQ